MIAPPTGRDAPPAVHGETSTPKGELARLLAEFSGMAAAEKHAEICALMPAAVARHPGAPLFTRWAEAAFKLGKEGALRQVVSRAIATELPGRARATLAWIFMRGDRLRDAYAVLTADPGIFQDIAARRQVIATLNGIVRNAVAPEDLRLTARALVRRILREDDTAWSVAPFRFASQASAPAASHCTRIRLDPKAPATALEAIKRTLRKAEQHHLQLGSAPDIRVYADVFINRAGQIWREDGAIVRSGGIPLLQASLDAAVNRIPSIDEGVLAVGDTANFNHWFANWIPAIAWRFEPGVPDLPILIRDDAPTFQAESLRLIGGPNVPMEPVAAALFVRRLYVAPTHAVRVDSGGAGRSILDRLAAVGDEGSGGSWPGRVFISRRDSRRRRPANESEIEDVFIQQGFQPVVLSDLGLVDQIRVFRQANVVAGAHGAGLTLLFAARPGALAYEILPYMPATLPVRLCMARMSRMFGHRHGLWVAPCDERTEIWSTDTTALTADLRAFLADGAPGGH